MGKKYFLWAALLLFIFWLPVRAGRAERIFYYLDKQGAIASATKLALVPEPFATAYQSFDKAAKQSPTAQQQPIAIHGLGEPVEQIHQQREAFRGVLLYWRRLIIVLLQKLLEEQTMLDQLQVNPMLAQIPPFRGDIQQQSAHVVAVREQLQHAIEMVTVQLPKQASQQHIPPAWFGP